MSVSSHHSPPLSTAFEEWSSLFHWCWLVFFPSQREDGYGEVGRAEVEGSPGVRAHQEAVTQGSSEAVMVKVKSPELCQGI